MTKTNAPWRQTRLDPIARADLLLAETSPEPNRTPPSTKIRTTSQKYITKPANLSDNRANPNG